MKNFYFGVVMRLVFLMNMNIPSLLENATVTTGRETPLFIA
jgi:hypothetical protein